MHDRRRVLPCQLDQVAHQRRQLRDLRLQVLEDLGAVRLGQRRRPGSGGRGKQLQVRPHRRQRGPQLVARVRDQPALLLLGRRERAEHVVEACGEPGQLVRAVHGDRLQLAGRGNALGRRRQPLHRAQARAGHGHSERARPSRPRPHRSSAARSRAASAPAGWAPAAGRSRARAPPRRPPRPPGMTTAPRPPSGPTTRSPRAPPRAPPPRAAAPRPVPARTAPARSRRAARAGCRLRRAHRWASRRAAAGRRARSGRRRWPVAAGSRRASRGCSAGR